MVDFNAGPRSVKSDSSINQAQFLNKKRRFDNRVHIPDNLVMADGSDEESYSEEFDSDESQD